MNSEAAPHRGGDERPAGPAARGRAEMTTPANGVPDHGIEIVVGEGVDFVDMLAQGRPSVHFSREEFDAFVEGAKAGEFDFDRPEDVLDDRPGDNACDGPENGVVDGTEGVSNDRLGRESGADPADEAA